MESIGNTNSVLITQSNYIPWKGYFDNINMVDCFVLYDKVQYTRRDWRNRNYIKTPDGLKWLTIPVKVKGKYNQSIEDTKVSDPDWTEKHLKALYQNYRQADSFDETYEFIESTYKSVDSPYLTDINYCLLKAICDFLGIKTKIVPHMDVDLGKPPNERLVALCKELGATDYYTGPAAKSYLNEEVFLRENIAIHYFEYSGYREYNQLYPPFEHGVSIVDLIFNEGHEARKYLKTTAAYDKISGRC